MTHITTNSWASSNKKMPTALIAVQKNRIRQYGKNFYLADGQEFEIELYNPTTSEVLAVIRINDESIGQAGSGIVLRPGERIWLERFLDSKAKFKFSTYRVSTSAESIEAIANNGSVHVDFYAKKSPIYFNNTGSTISWTNYNQQPFNWTTHNVHNSTPTNGSAFTSNGLNFNSSIGSATSDTLNVAGSYSNYSAQVKSIETGRVEHGSESSQYFATVDMQFEAIPFCSADYKILPLSTKPIYSKDLKIAKYCTDCGTRTKENWKFCATCGNKI